MSYQQHIQFDFDIPAFGLVFKGSASASMISDLV